VPEQAEDPTTVTNDGGATRGATTNDGPSALELVVDARATLGEGPTWDAARGILWWVDILAERVHGFDPRTGEDRAIDVGSTVGAVALRGDGTLLVAVAGGLATLDPDGAGGPTALVRLGEPGDGLRCNDGKADPAGRYWIGRMALDGTSGAGSLLRVDPDLAVTTHLTGLTIPNGLGWSPDGRTMHYVDSAWGEVRAFPFDPVTGTIGEGRSLVRIAAIDGLAAGSVPDGMTVDAEGCAWIAIWGGGCVVRVAPDGAVLGRIDLPVSHVTSCAFGGDDLADLYVTTARAGLGPEQLGAEPLAGGLFRCRPGVRGLLPVPFAG
jgi:sugar lactone lactonase YvrE